MRRRNELLVTVGLEEKEHKGRANRYVLRHIRKTLPERHMANMTFSVPGTLPLLEVTEHSIAMKRPEGMTFVYYMICIQISVGHSFRLTTEATNAQWKVLHFSWVILVFVNVWLVLFQAGLFRISKYNHHQLHLVQNGRRKQFEHHCKR
jgi:hypothetical protein